MVAPLSSQRLFPVVVHGCPPDTIITQIKALTLAPFCSFGVLPRDRFCPPTVRTGPWTISFDTSEQAHAFVRAHHEIPRGGPGVRPGAEDVHWDIWIGWKVQLRVEMVREEGKGEQKLFYSSPASSPVSSPLSSPPGSPSVASPTPGSTDSAFLAPTDSQHPTTSRRKRQAPHTTPSPPLSPTRRVTSSGQDVPSPTLCAKKRRIVSPPSSPSPLSEVISPKQATSPEPELEPEQFVSPEVQKQPVNLRAQVLVNRGGSEPPRRIPFFKFKGEPKNPVAILPAGEEYAAGEATSRSSAVTAQASTQVPLPPSLTPIRASPPPTTALPPTTDLTGQFETTATPTIPIKRASTPIPALKTNARPLSFDLKKHTYCPPAPKPKPTPTTPASASPGPSIPEIFIYPPRPTLLFQARYFNPPTSFFLDRPSKTLFVPRFTAQPDVQPASFFKRFPSAARESGSRREVVWKCPVDDAGLGGAVKEMEQARWAEGFGRQEKSKREEEEGEVERALREIEAAVGGVEEECS